MPSPPASHRDQLTQVSFHCTACGRKFKAEPSRIESAPERDHPYLYFCACPGCQSEAAQASWEKALLASYGKHTGPKTPAGRARSSENIAGHPTPEESQRLRFNALKHGMFARTATYFPARPGRYAECEGCHYRDTTCREQTACLKQTELFMRYHLAFENGDPRSLLDIQAETQASIQWIIRSIIMSIVRTGVELKAPKWYFDPVGKKMHIVSFVKDPNKRRADADPEDDDIDANEGEVEYVYEYSAHPLLKTLGDFVAKNNLSLADFNMTPKVQEDQEMMGGFLDSQRASSESLNEFAERSAKALETLKPLIERSQSRKSRDPVLLEHQEAENNG